MIGKIINNKYKIEKEIGIGGMSTVFLASDIILKRKVALKMLHPHLSRNKEHLKRFEREALILANLNHPNIIKVYEYFYFERNYFIVNEYIDGYTLKEFIDKNKIKYPVVSMMIAYIISDSLSYAHKKNIIHRDIKPENIMISKKGDIKIMDFGIGRFTNDSTLTETGEILGSPSYMSPEQALGSEINQKSDIFSLSILIYYLLTGISPFQANSSITTIRNIIKLKYDSPTKFNRLIDESYLEIFKKTFIKEENKRISALEISKIIKSIIDSEGIKKIYSKELKKYFQNVDEYNKELKNKLIKYYYYKAKTLYKHNKLFKTTFYCNKLLEIDPSNEKIKKILIKLKLHKRNIKFSKIILVSTINIIFIFLIHHKYYLDNQDITNFKFKNKKILQPIVKLYNIIELKKDILNDDYLDQIISEKKKEENKKTRKIKSKIKRIVKKIKKIKKENINKQNKVIESNKKKLKNNDFKINKIKEVKFGYLDYCFRPYAKVFINNKKEKSFCVKKKIKYGKYRIKASYPFSNNYNKNIVINDNNKNISIRHNFTIKSIIEFDFKYDIKPLISIKKNDDSYVKVKTNNNKQIVLELVPYNKNESYFLDFGEYFLDIKHGSVVFSNIKLILNTRKKYKIFMDLKNEKKLKVY